MIAHADAAILLQQAMQLTPGCRMPGQIINPNVSSAFERAQHAAGSVYVATHRFVAGPSLQDVADHLAQPLFVPATLDERALLTAQAVLRARMLDHASGEYLYAGRSQRIPVNEDTVAAAVELLTAALSSQQQKDAA